MEKRLEHRSYKDVSSLKDADFENSKNITIFVKDLTKDEIKNVISGVSKVINGANIQATASYLRRSQGADSLVEGSRQYQKQERENLKTYISENNLWISENYQNYLDEGAEQKVYFVNEKYVVKLNDSAFYSSWLDYFNSLLLHNYFFPATAYELIGFMEIDNFLFSIVRQPYIKATTKTDLQIVKNFMSDNGFVNIRNNDYENKELGIILEDLHDENVLTKDGLLQFVDTVFYIKDKNMYADDGSFSDNLKHKYLQKSEASKDQQEQFDEKEYGKRITIEQELYIHSTKTHIKTYPDGVRASFVDGKYIRDNINSDFAQGSNGYAHPNYVPLNEVWVEEIQEEEVEPVLLHEKTEYDLMKTGVSYSEAHDIAKAKEEEYRSRRTLAGGGNIEKSIYAHTINKSTQHRTKIHRTERHKIKS